MLTYQTIKSKLKKKTPWKWKLNSSYESFIDLWKVDGFVQHNCCSLTSRDKWISSRDHFICFGNHADIFVSSASLTHEAEENEIHTKNETRLELAWVTKTKHIMQCWLKWWWWLRCTSLKWNLKKKKKYEHQITREKYFSPAHKNWMWKLFALRFFPLFLLFFSFYFNAFERNQQTNKNYDEKNMTNAGTGKIYQLNLCWPICAFVSFARTHFLAGGSLRISILCVFMTFNNSAML